MNGLLIRLPSRWQMTPSVEQRGRWNHLANSTGRSSVEDARQIASSLEVLYEQLMIASGELHILVCKSSGVDSIVVQHRWMTSNYDSHSIIA